MHRAGAAAMHELLVVMQIEAVEVDALAALDLLDAQDLARLTSIALPVPGCMTHSAISSRWLMWTPSQARAGCLSPPCAPCSGPNSCRANRKIAAAIRGNALRNGSVHQLELLTVERDNSRCFM